MTAAFDSSVTFINLNQQVSKSWYSDRTQQIHRSIAIHPLINLLELLGPPLCKVIVCDGSTDAQMGAAPLISLVIMVSPLLSLLHGWITRGSEGGRGDLSTSSSYPLIIIALAMVLAVTTPAA
ncbi:hypothetical protein BJY52DRAFT_1276616 [Lactarius psammicola]|nr:hypothetical protein BJY52DRAFT_1276616 [Lactarius psammicola]